MNTDKIKQDYIEGKPLPLPYESKFGCTLQTVNGSCSKCHGELDHLRGKINEFAQCIEVRMSGICENCKMIVECSPVRVYDDGRFMFKDEEDGWQERHSGFSSNVLKTMGVIILGIIIVALMLFM